MPRTQSTTLTLPPFGGATRRLVLLNLGAFFLIALLGWVTPLYLELFLSHLILVPAAVLRGELWQLATYSLVERSILGILFGMLTLWFAGALLETAFGARWVAELYAVSVVGAGILSTLLATTHIFGLRTDVAGAGAWAGIFGLLIGIAMRFGDQEFLLWFVVRIKAKYMVAIYLLLALAMLLKQGNALSALLELTGALSGFLFVRFASRQGLTGGLTERWYALQNDLTRARRRRAARKFEVYMRKQNREVRFDGEGRYIEPEDPPRTKPNGAHRPSDSAARPRDPRNPRDPNDRSWMN